VLEFSKYQGLGNDFLMLDGREATDPEFVFGLTPEQVVQLCDRRFGVGGDGVILALPPNNGGELRMRIFNADGTWKQGDALRAAFEGAGVDLDKPITLTCGSGITASTLAFGLHLLGKDLALYDGSWSEWGADRSTPKAMGAKEAVDAIFDTIAKTLKKEGSMALVGFGTFKTGKRAARTGRNPQTGATIKIAASKTVRFKASKQLKGSI